MKNHEYLKNSKRYQKMSPKHINEYRVKSLSDGHTSNIIALRSARDRLLNIGAEMSAPR